MTTLNSIHDKMHRELASVGGRIDAVFYCPHSADDNCDCRKPKTGMIKEIAKRFSVELDKVYAVGDALRDLQAFANSGCKTILVRTAKVKKPWSKVAYLKISWFALTSMRPCNISLQINKFSLFISTLSLHPICYSCVQVYSF